MDGEFATDFVRPKLQKRPTMPGHPSPSDALTKYRDSWKYSGKEQNVNAFNYRVEELVNGMVNALQSFPKETEAKSAAIKDIKNFIIDREGKNAIDSCVRSLILYHLVEAENATDTEVELIKVITDSESLLSFESPSSRVHDDKQRAALLPKSLKSRCKYKDKHWGYRNVRKSTPFHMAATNGQAKALGYMMEGLEKHCKTTEHPESLLETLQLKNPDSNKGLTALEIAVSERHMGTLEELLKYPEIAIGSDNGFKMALEDGSDEVVELFLQHDEICEVFITSEHIKAALDRMLKEEVASEKWNKRMKIVRSLLRRATRSKGLDNEVVSIIIRNNLTEAWEECGKNVPLHEGNLLHLAVSSQNAKFVNLFVEKDPKSVMTKAIVPTMGFPGAGNKIGGYYPLWYNNKKWEKNEWVDMSGSPAIRESLVTAAIRQNEKMQTLSDVLQESGEKARELCFDISQFNSKSHRLHDFIHSLIFHKENEGLLSYEPTIKYASFPALDLHVDDKELFETGPCKEHTEVFDVLDWLKETKEVTSILELKVPDRLFNPHDELKIAGYVHDFKVEVLNWRFMDLSLSVFSSKVKGRIRTVHLYSSGKRAAISHWLSSDGLDSFTALSEVRVHLVQETMTRKQCSQTRKYLEHHFEAKFQGHLKWTILSQPWNPVRESATNLEEIAQKAFPKLSRFISSYRNLLTAPGDKPAAYRPTKVAVIDNGIMSMSPEITEKQRHISYKSHRSRKSKRYRTLPADDGSTEVDPFNTHDDEVVEADENLGNPKTLWTRVGEGRSFVDNDFQVSPWLFASDPHGTQMANLICALDPGCELYVAKVSDSTNGITPERVSRAINWARERKVDIISMSFSMLEQTEGLSESINKANSEGIVMFCSSHDEGSKTLECWPADAKETNTVVACDEYGTLLREVAKDKYDYKIYGAKVAAGTVPFLESKDRISGSSVATATAAALGSLMISCAHLSGQANGSKNTSIVQAYFKQMLSGEGSKHVLLEKFGGIDEKIKEGEPIDANNILAQKFFFLKK